MAGSKEGVIRLEFYIFNSWKGQVFFPNAFVFGIDFSVAISFSVLSVLPQKIRVPDQQSVMQSSDQLPNLLAQTNQNSI